MIFLINGVIWMNKKYIFMAFLCAVFPLLSMNQYALIRYDFSRENRMAMRVHMRPQAMHEEGIIPNYDLITLESADLPNQECLECGAEPIDRHFFYGLGCLVALAQYGPSICAALSV